jgi:hypothetical protein
VNEHDARDAGDSLRLLLAEWRVGGSVGRTLYAIFGPEHGHEHARDDDAVMIGVRDTEQLARGAALAHNEWLAKHRS